SPPHRGRRPAHTLLRRVPSLHGRITRHPLHRGSDVTALFLPPQSGGRCRRRKGALLILILILILILAPGAGPKAAPFTRFAGASPARGGSDSRHRLFPAVAGSRGISMPAARPA